MKISYTIYNQQDEIVRGGVCDFHELSDIQWEEFNNGNLVVAEIAEDE